MEQNQAGAAALSQVSKHAHDAGAELAHLLFSAQMPEEQKEAWAELVPFMDTEQLQRLVDLLKKNLTAQVAVEAEDTMLLMKAAQMKRNFAIAHADAEANAVLDEVEKELAALESKKE